MEALFGTFSLTKHILEILLKTRIITEYITGLFYQTLFKPRNESQCKQFLMKKHGASHNKQSFRCTVIVLVFNDVLNLVDKYHSKS